ncbi:MAG TPA: hypothetical protein VKV21_02860 [Solirubrobacteraceae bacterium]|nr:hypothetical protein [Solirubrobacteraceae bacterium]
MSRPQIVLTRPQMRTTLAAALAAAIALVVADLAHASEPGQLVLAAAATAALVATGTGSRSVRAQSWSTVRVLLSLNLGAFGFSIWTRSSWLAAPVLMVAGALFASALLGYRAGKRQDGA